MQTGFAEVGDAPIVGDAYLTQVGDAPITERCQPVVLRLSEMTF